MPEEAFRIVFAGGGTGGHLFPALSVADELGRRHPGARISFVGDRRGLEQTLVPRAGYPLRSMRLSGIKGRGGAARAAAGLVAAAAVGRCLIWMMRERPDLVIGVGGYASGPAVLAATWLRVRTMALEQNHFPGATNRFLARRVDAICLPSEAARERLGGVGRVTGTPVRDGFAGLGPPPEGERLSLLVFGGSRGAHSINLAMIDALPRIATIEPAPRIAHQTGQDDAARVREAYARLYPEHLFEIHPFMEDMPRRFSAADLVVCRAGASTLAELAVAGRPAILVPYPHAADDHQRHNAVTVQDAGAAEIVLDHEVGGGKLAEPIIELSNDPARRREMARAARALAQPEATQRIADVAGSLLSGKEAADVS